MFSMYYAVLILNFPKVLSNTLDINGMDMDVIEDFYWRDYFGKIPNDAMPGGVDEFNETTYIGQVVYSGNIIPGQLRPKNKEIQIYWTADSISLHQNLKILCSNHAERFRWIKVKDAWGLKLLNRKRLVIGGCIEFNLYIARARYYDQLVVGRFIMEGSKNTQYFKGVSNTNLIETATFEVLYYTGTATMRSDSSCNTPITVFHIILALYIFLRYLGGVVKLSSY